MASNNSSSSSLPDAESQKTMSDDKISHWRLVRDPALVTNRVLNHHYQGSGTDADPYLVEFIENDPRNPMLFPQWKKWLITIDMAIATLAVAFVSSAYTGGVAQLLEQFRVSSEVITLGVSLFVLGFAIGPVFWAPLSELYGRQTLFTITYGCLTAFNAGAAGAQNIQTLLVLRFLAGCFGSSPLTNAGGVIADMFNAEQRGIATSLFAVAPFMGPGK
jgi:sugar phosphate permease